MISRRSCTLLVVPGVELQVATCGCMREASYSFVVAGQMPTHGKGRVAGDRIVMHRLACVH